MTGFGHLRRPILDVLRSRVSLAILDEIPHTEADPERAWHSDETVSRIVRQYQANR